MKVEQNKPEDQFHPVTITLDSQLELDVLVDHLRDTHNRGNTDSVLFNLYAELVSLTI